ncbi:hypothetical protein REC12_11470 [Desulfosporosinus sp. PR]|uniref:hypothetical protein n=1 Tax=Candidatus Desulfosporosinus nitrosoreducens TaxID=3401928 RepID=UPI0027EBE989|nr:hypothetical protein [Desulfosporosinus sp. PR]MDQ7094208.1 hypothetical protein [Desulfosporosinus sp. PR]
MIKVLANKVLAFNCGEKDAKGNIIRHCTKVGFCELPDWVEKDPYFQAAITDKSILSVGASSESESVLKEMERLEALKAEVKAMEEKRDLLAKENTAGTTIDAPPSDPDLATDKKSKDK